jgi:anti-sigma factor RsiW
VNAACDELQVLISLRAAGALEPAEEATVASHLAGCAPCRAEAERDAAILDLARLPPASDREVRLVAGVPARALPALHRVERRRGIAKRIVTVLAAVAAATAMVVAPVLLRKPAPELVADVAAATWEEPDLDGLWGDTEVLELEPAAASGADETDAAYAALDAGVGRQAPLAQ